MERKRGLIRFPIFYRSHLILRVVFWSITTNFFFTAKDSNDSFRIWVSDGTIEGTRPFQADDIEGNPSGLDSLTILNGLGYFPTSNWGSAGWRLTSDATPENLNLVNIFRTIDLPSSPVYLTDFNGRLYFFLGRFNGNRCNNWTSDETPEGTFEILPPDPIANYCPLYTYQYFDGSPCFTGYGKLGNSLFFAANYTEDSIGCELYKITLPQKENYQENECGELHYLLYPNPASDRAKLLLEAKNPTTVSVRIFDMAGRLMDIIAKEKLLEAGNEEIPINLNSNYAAGIYFLEITGGECREWLKLNVVYLEIIRFMGIVCFGLSAMQNILE